MYRAPVRRRLAALTAAAVLAGAVVGLAATSAASPSSSRTLPSTTALPPTTALPTTATTTNTSPHAEISAAPLSDLHPGDQVIITVSGRFGPVATTTATVCRTTGVCAYRAPAGTDAIVQFGGSGSFPFTVGIGEYASQSGTTFVCDRSHPCELEVTAHMEAPTQSYAAFRLAFAYDAPTTTTTTTTVRVPTTAPTTTTAPPVLCAVRRMVPQWLWALLVELFGVSC